MCRQFAGQHRQILKRASFKDAAPAVQANLSRRLSQIAVDCSDVVEFRTMGSSGESVHQSAKNSLDCAVVNIRVRSVQVAQRFLQAVLPGFEYKPFMLRAGTKRPIDRESKLEGHVEARCCRRVPVKLNPRQVVKRVAAFPNQFDDSLEPPFAAGNLDGCSRSQTESAETSDKCKIKILVVTVIRDVEESRFLPSALGHRALFHDLERLPEAREPDFLLRFCTVAVGFPDFAGPSDLISLARACNRRIRVFETPYVSAKSSAVGNGVVMTTCLCMIVRYSKRRIV